MSTILVIGGGISGLSAAAELLRRGRRVILIEAQSRLGGRVHTVRHGNFPIELGAEFIHGRHKLLWAAIREAGLSTHEVSDCNRFYEEGRLRVVDLWEMVSEVFSSTKPATPDISVGELLNRPAFDDLTRRLTLGFVQEFNAAHPARMSVHAMLRADYAAGQMNGADQFRITDGYGVFVDFLAAQVERLGGTVLTNSVVQSIAWKSGYVEVLVKGKSTDETIGADAAVIALPLGVMKARAVRFDPALPEKDEAAAALELGNVVKLTMVFRERWWGEADFGFIHALNKRLPTWWSHPANPILTGWAGGPKADDLTSCSRAEVEDLALASVAEILDTDAGKVSSLLAGTYSFRWASDPFARGAYSYIPVNGLDLPKVLAAQVADTLFFAGEATVTEAQTGTVFGAFESGMRAAGEICAVK